MAIEWHIESQDQDQSRSTQQKVNEPVLVPYVEIDGRRTILDATLARVYEKICDEGKHGYVFGDKDIKSSSDFIRNMKSPINISVFVMRGNECTGFAFLNNVIANYASGHFCFFDDEPEKESVGKSIIRYWFSLGNGALDVIIGMVPIFNIRAIWFVRQIGFKVCGTIPQIAKNLQGEKCSVVIVYLERDEQHETTVS